MNEEGGMRDASIVAGSDPARHLDLVKVSLGRLPD